MMKVPPPSPRSTRQSLPWRPRIATSATHDPEFTETQKKAEAAVVKVSTSKMI